MPLFFLFIFKVYLTLKKKKIQLNVSFSSLVPPYTWLTCWLRFRLLVQKPSTAVGGWSGYIMEFTCGSWLGLVVTALICSFGATLVLRVASKEQYAGREAVLIVLGCLCLQGDGESEKKE